MSPVATRLYRYLRTHEDQTELTIEELTTAVGKSKTAVRAAIVELSEAGLLTYEQTS